MVTVPFDSPSHSKGDGLFRSATFVESCSDWDVFRNCQKILWKDIINLVTSVAASKFCVLVLFGIDVFILY